MLCPACKSSDNKVIDSRVTEAGSAIRRRRVCSACERRFTTKERLEDEVRLTVIKADGHRVPYNRDNIFGGLARACTKLEVSEAKLQELVDRVEADIFAHHDREVKTEDIGRYIGKRLRRLNAVAYVRFMSVHRKFSSVDAFIEEIRDVRERRAQENPTQQSLFEA